MAGRATSLIVRVEGKGGDILGSSTLPKLTHNWQKFTATITVEKSETKASLAIVDNAAGNVAIGCYLSLSRTYLS